MPFPYPQALKDSINQANLRVHEATKSLPANTPITNFIDIQLEIYSRQNLQEYSLRHQIETIIFKDTSAPQINGICFIDFDDTILNLQEYSLQREMYQRHWKMQYDRAAASKKPPPFSIIRSDLRVCYNAVSYPRWQNVLKSVISKNYKIILLTNRSRIIGEDESVQQLLYDKLEPFFTGHLFTGYLENKGAIIQYFSSLCRISVQNCVLIDDQKTHIEQAQSYGVSAIQAQRLSQTQFATISQFPAHLRNPFNSVTRMVRTEEPNFIRQMLALPRVISSVPSHHLGRPVDVPTSAIKRADSALFSTASDF